MGCLILVLLPVVDVFLLWGLGRWIGAWPTVGMIVAAAIIGVPLVRIELLRELRQLGETVRRKGAPELTVISAFLVPLGGVLLVFPGPASDVLGLALLLPRTRLMIARLLRRRWQAAVETGNVTFWAGQRENTLGPIETQEDVARAIDVHERAAAAAQTMGNLEDEANHLGRLGTCYRMSGDIPKSINSLQRSLALFQKLGDVEGQALGLANLGNSFHRLGDLPKAIDLYQEALAVFGRMGLPENHPRVQAIQEALADARGSVVVN